MTMISLASVTAGYDGVQVLRNVDFEVKPGEVVALLGPNGAGKSTLLRTAAGFVRPTAGTVSCVGADMTNRRPHHFARSGVCLVPEGRGVFPSLTVAENLRVQAGRGHPAAAIDQATEFFPPLRNLLHRTAGSMSGGEQQMLALCRSYITDPKVVLVDEASLGLAPLVIDKIYDGLARLVERGVALVLVEQYVHRVLELANTVYVLSRGEIVHRGPAGGIDAEQIYEKYLGVDQ